MIGYISGLIIEIDPEKNTLIILTQGIGYRVFVTNECLTHAKEDQKIQLHIHTSVREDDISLYGFETGEALKFFNQLISVSGIGPKMAMEILSAPVHLTQNAILSGDIEMLTKIKGLGKKTAERMVVELKNKVTPITLGGAGRETRLYNEDAVLALEGLGYDRMEIVKVITKVPEEVEETEDIVKYFLKQTQA